MVLTERHSSFKILTPGLFFFSKLPNLSSICKALAPLIVAHCKNSDKAMWGKCFRSVLISSTILSDQLLAKLSVPKTMVQLLFRNKSIGGRAPSIYWLAFTQRQKKVLGLECWVCRCTAITACLFAKLNC